jgi:hypothetical protein
MTRFRFNIASLLVIIFILGVGLAALRESSEVWQSALFTLTIGVLLVSALFAIHRTEMRRAFWIGFALFGSAYLGLSLVPSIESRLITTRALAFLDSKISRSFPLTIIDFDNDGSMDLLVANNSQPMSLDVNNGNGTFQDVTSATGSNTSWVLNALAVASPKGSSGTTESFVQIGHSLLALIAAFLGGLLSRYLHTKTKQGTSAPVPAPLSISNVPEV